jgi:hypothetical protein
MMSCDWGGDFRELGLRQKKASFLHSDPTKAVGSTSSQGKKVEN